MRIRASVLSPTVLTPFFLVSLLALPLGAAYAQSKSAVTLNCSYAESTHAARTKIAGGGQEWMPAHDVVYRICAGCTVDKDALPDAAVATGGQPPVWSVTDSEYSCVYNNGNLYVGVKINRYSGSATVTMSDSDAPELYVGGIAVYTSSGKCQKADKPIL